jgi:Flp pilus assembly protein TadG
MATGQGMLQSLPKYLRRLAREISRFAGTRGGATAVEFALIAPPFLATLLAILEVTLFLFGQMALQNAANEAARYFLTGQAQNSNPPWTASYAVSQVCPAMLFNCSNLFIVVQSAASFSAANTSAPAMYNSSGAAYTQSDYTFDPGTQGEIMVVQLVYAWPAVPAPLGFNIGNLPHGAIEMMGVSAFRVEPYAE